MSETITRIYGTAENAAGAVQLLGRLGFTDDLIRSSALADAGRPGAVGQNHWSVTVRAPFGMGRMATETLDEFSPISSVRYETRDPGLQSIARLSGPVSPGAISRLSGPVSAGAIARLSGPVSPGAISRLSKWISAGSIARLSSRVRPGAISKLSGHVSPGAISRLSGHVSPGAISRLSGPVSPAEISTLSGP